MTENIERSFVNGSEEPNGDETSEFIKQRDHHTTEIAKLLNSVREETSFRSNLSTYQSIHRHLMFLKDLDPEWGLTPFWNEECLRLRYINCTCLDEGTPV